MEATTDRRRGIVAAAVVLIVIGVTALAIAFARQEPAPPEHPGTSVPAHHDSHRNRPVDPEPTADKVPVPQPTPPEEREETTPADDSRSAIRGPEAGSAPPVSVSIPALDVTSDLISLGLNDDQTMEVPSDPAAVGWFTKAPTPGALGPAVLAGHVTWDQSPAVFFDLADLEPGDSIEIERSDQKTAVFAVTGVEQYAKDRFPTERVYGVINHAGLRLITCAGEFDTDTGNYRDNIVVYAKLSTVR